MKGAVIFDLDGTLVDSAPDLALAINRVLEAEGARPLDLSAVTGFIGDGLPKLVARAMAARDLAPAHHQRLTEAMRIAYARAGVVDARLYPGAAAALRRLSSAGYRLALCTNKPEGPARDMLAHFDLSDLFGTVIGGDSLPVTKPDPSMLRAAAGQVGAALDNCVFVGDSEVDTATAAAAGVPFLLFTGGYRKTPAEALTPQAGRFDHHDGLFELVGHLLAAGGRGCA